MLKEPTPVLILGGWSPGPLNYLKYGRRNCIFLEPKIPMPPVGLSWCWDWSVLALLVVVILMIWAFSSVGAVVTAVAFRDNRSSSSSWPVYFVARLTVVAASLVAVRLCVAWIVRTSMQRGVRQAKSYLNDVTVVIGFSWGGGIVAELLRLGLVGRPTQPAALLICPTSAVMASLALHSRDAATVIRLEDAREHVHVFHAKHDGVFCPNASRWEQAGVTLHWCDDNHVMTRPESIQALTETLDAMVQQSKRLHCY